MRSISAIFLVFAFVSRGMVVCGEAPGSGNSGRPQPGILLEPAVLESSDDPVSRPAFADSGFQKERSRMVQSQIARRGVDDHRVLEAMREVPRHLFVAPSLVDRTYRDYPLPIGHGQTISQPYIVGLMTELLDLEKDDTVLEVGTGSGYQAAILSRIVRNVVSIEIIKPLADQTAANLSGMGFQNILLLQGDGYFGYKDKAPYDAIIVTAASEHIPPPLISQLKPGGRMIIPVGPGGWTQNLILVKKSGDENITTRNILPVRFVPLTRGRE